MTPGKIGIRADASNRIGSGHLMRCLGLADALRERGAESLFFGRLPPHLIDLVRAQGHAFVPADPGAQGDEPADAAAAAAAFAGASWVVVDHYGLGCAWELRMRELTGARLLAIDDLERRHDCDVLLDPNFHVAPDHRYEGLLPPACTRLLGPRHALLRPEFAAARASVRPRDGDVRRLLVFMGGADQDNLTTTVLRAVARLDHGGLAVDAVIGASHPAEDQVRALCQGLHQGRCHVQTRDMAGLLARADLAIGAGGGATWERCALGVPTLALCLADNQKNVLLQGSRAGFLYFAEEAVHSVDAIELHLRALLGNPGLRHHLSRTAFEVSDALGARRVADCLGGVRVRRATLDDGHRLHGWRNHPRVRAMSRDPSPIALETHLHWLEGVLRAPMRHLLVGEDGLGQALGTVRFDADPGGVSAEVSVYLAPDRMGQGLGTALLLAAQAWLGREHPGIRRLQAHVQAGNEASRRLFERCGYQMCSALYIKEP